MVPERVVGITLNGLIAATQQQNEGLLRTHVVDNPLTERGAQLMWAWTRIVQTGGLTAPAAVRNRETIDTLLAGEHWHWGYRAVFTHDLDARLAQVECPAFLICASEDRAIKYMERAQAALPNAKVCTPEGGVFYIQVETDVFSPVLLDFLASAELPRSARDAAPRPRG